MSVGGAVHGPIESANARPGRDDAGPGGDATADVLGPSVHPHPMPDVASAPPKVPGAALDRVGMSGIQSMVRVQDEQGGEILLPATADAYVSLDDPSARGIHMSRLYLDLQQRLERERLDLPLVESLLGDFVTSQRGLSSRASLRIAFAWPLHRRALLSANRGWRHYPVALTGETGPAGTSVGLEVGVTYSSTCPCSAALSRQAAQEAFDLAFGDRVAVPADELRAWLGEQVGMPATPHSQRSTALITIVPQSASSAPDSWVLVDAVEQALATPVQTAVKREDEQAFALRNGANLMFCEDAARRIRQALELLPGLADYRIRVDHHESLHPHDATAVVTRGVANGLRP
jgi:GTP cyclohydrolase I